MTTLGQSYKACIMLAFKHFLQFGLEFLGNSFFFLFFKCTWGGGNTPQTKQQTDMIFCCWEQVSVGKHPQKHVQVPSPDPQGTGSLQVPQASFTPSWSRNAHSSLYSLRRPEKRVTQQVGPKLPVPLGGLQHMPLYAHPQRAPKKQGSVDFGRCRWCTHSGKDHAL